MGQYLARSYRTLLERRLSLVCCEIGFVPPQAYNFNDDIKGSGVKNPVREHWNRQDPADSKSWFAPSLIANWFMCLCAISGSPVY